MKTLFAINSFAPSWLPCSRVALLLFELVSFYGLSAALRVMCDHHCASARDLGPWEGLLGPRNGLYHGNSSFLIMHENLFCSHAPDS